MSTRPQPDWYYHRHPYALTPLAEGEEPQLLPIQDQRNHKKSKIWMAYKAPIVQWYKNAMLIKDNFWKDLESSHQIIWYPYKVCLRPSTQPIFQAVVLTAVEGNQ